MVVLMAAWKVDYLVVLMAASTAETMVDQKVLQWVDQTVASKAGYLVGQMVDHLAVLMAA